MMATNVLTAESSVYLSTNCMPDTSPFDQS